MAVVNLKSDLIANIRLGETPPPPEKLRGSPVVATFTVTNGATDSALSDYHICDIPAEAILDESTILKVDGWGFATVNLGIKGDVDAVGTVARATGTYWSPILVGDAKHGLPAWQALGLAAAPDNGIVSLFLQGPANATGAGTCKGKIAFRFRG